MGVASSQPGGAAARRIGLLGGSFDPVHYAHLRLAEAALRHLQLDTLEFVPANAPWQREPLGASPGERVAMLELATADLPGVRINTIEIDRTGPTYTLDTLKALKAKADPATEYFWILGSDQLANFTTWHAWRDIVGLAQLAVAARPGSSFAPVPELARELAERNRILHVIPFAPLELSASDIRHRLATGQAIDGLTPPAVVNYIKSHHLYQAR